MAPAPAALLDRVGKAIMRELQEDGRRSYTGIAAAVGLSEAAVRSRVKALIDSGVLQIVAVTDPLTLGFGVMASIGVMVNGDSRAAAEALSDIEEVDYCVLTSGRYDLQLEVVARHALELIARRELLEVRVRDVEQAIERNPRRAGPFEHHPHLGQHQFSPSSGPRHEPIASRASG